MCLICVDKTTQKAASRTTEQQLTTEHLKNRASERKVPGITTERSNELLRGQQPNNRTNNMTEQEHDRKLNNSNALQSVQDGKPKP